MRKVHILSLGCSKNLVDSEELKGLLLTGGLRYSDKPESADILIINTCGFILPAKEESIEAILQALRLKESGQIRSLIVMGCLSQRYREELKAELPGVDAFFGVNQIPELARYLLHRDAEAAPRSLMTPGHYAFLKIAEGCDNRCAYCAIPLIRGRQRSLTPESIRKEAEYLAGKGVKELIVIAQDTTTYGRDLPDKPRLSQILKMLDDMEAFPWIRLHYTHPAHFDPGLIDVIKQGKSILPYIDMPVQHINAEVLRVMRRGRSGEPIRKLIAKLKREIPGLALRTTVMVGYPGETDAAFRELQEFVEKTSFDRLGAFVYSPEERTPAESLGDPVSAKSKEKRLERLMNLQQRISLEKNRELKGTVQRVLIDTYDAVTDDSYGRSYRDSPDIDNRIIIPGKLQPGEFYDIRITDALDYDLIGELV
ncbi:MAG: 30S ribosomal protein S12 methylthiotransferase RimO [Candidatus Marinimicrobia bacterium]|jgi:ribosomal protein S12 methylthiotransferase|nr:30S ribosomal protein S12 methylthiotransferase RimO [Candidatus Neomarinimicrobiota bacterium]MDD3967107.1 30S ribosomal protein S12 methylthiotransferase RimO [Candidatus Neomarinimicrobiota bacterium]MDD5710265.1 30S ribosomal protein S12 methylthiotransferase RimO [Candidatus Neomarinimicrobiota bacterium]MDX9778533.1 30S ribosomal protein S12 methylthiotransferase RimO [bacterium]